MLAASSVKDEVGLGVSKGCKKTLLVRSYEVRLNQITVGSLQCADKISANTDWPNG
jgi:hypothetical protein